MALGMVGIPVFPSDVLGFGLSIPDGAIMADHEELPWEMPGQSWSVSDDLGGAFRFYPLIFLQDGEQGILTELANMHHIDY